MALKLSSTVQAPAAPDVGSDHEISRKLSHFCEHQEVCEEHTPPFNYTPPGNMYINMSFIHSTYIGYALSVYNSTCSVQCKAKSVSA